ncbi:hypothetical protein CW354_01105 [Marinicaulis flavus]|uniref:Uncharacterized protein n=1 Tax=Hyphococcus luteus TaxID=2058213 RepID=A0A2S7KAJ0_9PROT|nr:hypothetical protein CW354_01105 [Marinicaulis flavus]
MIGKKINDEAGLGLFKNRNKHFQTNASLCSAGAGAALFGEFAGAVSGRAHYPPAPGSNKGMIRRSADKARPRAPAL